LTVGTLSAHTPLRRVDLANDYFRDRSDLWLGNTSSDFPMVMTLASQMRGHGSNRKGCGEQDCELRGGEHDDEREWEGKKESEGERERRGWKETVVVWEKKGEEKL